MADDPVAEPFPIDIEEGEIEESGEEASDAEQERASAKKGSLSRQSSNKSSGGQPKPKENGIPRKRNDDSTSASDSGGKSENSRKNDRPPKNFSKKGDRKRNKFDDDKDGRRKENQRRKSKESTFEDELKEYKQLSTSRARHHDYDREPMDGPHQPENHRRSSSPNARRSRPSPRGDGHMGPGPRGPPLRPPRRPREEFRPKEKRVPCKFFIEGRCKNGDDCPFSHNVAQQKKPEACKFYMGGFCQKGPSCVYMHGEFPCKFYHTGQQCYSGDNCKFSHEVLSPEQKRALDMLLEKENRMRRPREEFNEEGPMGPEEQGPHGHFRDDGNAPPPQWHNNRKRPDFFRETFPDNENPIDRGHGQFPDTEFGSGENEEHFGDRMQGGPESAENGEGQDRPLPRKQQEFMKRLQQRAQQSSVRHAEDDELGEPISSDSQEDNFRLKIDEREVREDNNRKERRNTQWNDSDDEDEGSDQIIADSLKRLQEEPNPPPWNYGPPDRGPRHHHMGPPPGPPPGPSHMGPPGAPPPYTQPDPYYAPNSAPYPQDRSYPPPRPDYNEYPPQPYYPKEEEIYQNRGKTLLPLPPPAQGPPREPLIVHTADYNQNYPSQFHTGPLVPPNQHNPPPYVDPNWEYSQNVPPVADPRLHGPPPPTGYVGQPPPFVNQPPPTYSHNVPQGPPHYRPPGERDGYPPVNVASPPQNSHYPPYGPVGQVPPPDLGMNAGIQHLNLSGDPRLQRHTPSSEALQSPTHEAHASPPSHNAPLPTPTLEAVLQQLLAKVPEITNAPELDASLSKNPDPPLYRLEPIEKPVHKAKDIFFRVCAFKTIEEVNRDPRLVRVMQSLTPAEVEKAKGSSSSTTVPAEPVESNEQDPKKASMEFDAFTAMLQAALVKTKKRDTDETGGSSPNAKKIRRVSANGAEA